MTENPTPPPASLFRALFHPWTWRMAWRDSRSQRRRLAVFAVSIVSGMAALIAIHALKATVEEGIAKETKSLLGSDLQVTSRDPLPATTLAAMRGEAAAMSTETAFASMMVFPGEKGARLVQVRGFTGGYPYYGAVETNPPGGWDALQNSGGILLEPGLMRQFNLNPGDEVRLGTASFTVRGEITKALPRGNRFSGFAPEAYVQESALTATGLLGTRSLAHYHAHLRLPDGTKADTLKSAWEKRYAGKAWRFETPDDRKESLEKALSAFQQFLGIVALVALMLGATGVASAVQAHLSRRVPGIAILRCLGCATGPAFAIHWIQVLVLGVAGTLAGIAIGICLHAVTLFFFRDNLPAAIPTGVPWLVVARTAAAGFALCCGFALFPLRRIRDIAPAQALRGGGALPPGSVRRAWPMLAVLAALVFVLAALNAPDTKQAVGMTVGLFAAFGLLAGTARLLMWASRRVLRPGWSYWLRQGVSNLHRPHNQTLLFLLSLGLCTFLLLSTILTRNIVLSRINLDSLKDSPGLYLVDVQADQTEGVRGLLKTHGIPAMESAPMVTMRLRAVNGTPVAELMKNGVGPRWLYQREFRSTFRDNLNATETLTAGEFNGQAGLQPGEVPVSLEKKIAADLRVAPGDTLDIDVQGVTLAARVTSIREVDWSRFNLNFFMVFPPSALEGAPAFHVVTARVPDGGSPGPMQNALAKAYPNVSVIDLGLVLGTVANVVGNIVTVIRVLAGFTLLAGSAIIIGTFLNGRDQRVRESVLLRTLGASSAQIRQLLVIEYATLGALSALTGIVLAQSAAFLLAKFTFKAAQVWSPGITIAIGAGAVLLSVLAGLATSRGVCRHPPLDVLRQIG